MKLRALTCLVVAASLSGCHKISNWMHKQDMTSEENFAAQEVVEPAHPVGASYDISSSDAPRKQLSLFFNGAGLARVLETGIGRDHKTLVDFKKHQIIHKDFLHNWQNAEALDPYSFPAVLTAKDAQQQKAVCLGTGAMRGFPYHRWGLRNNNNEWEVWTDDKDNFPIYYRTIKTATSALGRCLVPG